MRKIPAILAGAVVMGLGAFAAGAAWAPSLIGQKSDTHEMTLILPGGGIQTIVYAGNVPPKVKFHPRHADSDRPAFAALGWPFAAAWNPFVADLHHHFDLWPRPGLMALTPEQILGGIPSTRYSIISGTGGSGVCTRFTQITKGPGDAKPKIVSRTSGNCGDLSSKAESAPGTPAGDLRPATFLAMRPV